MLLLTGLQGRGHDFLADRSEVRARDLHMNMVAKMHEWGHCGSDFDRLDGPPLRKAGRSDGLIICI